nr:immunoglobulin heavy chain junction region [Mus musculus]NSM03684.1 immunoglobulin heavy chain junction region [Mus musculus]NSM04234.1 immunoglobulin heavy chain junction region [Mus musculus]NSM04697.1 immunoglobulin heavy chain junction region [Mus musculus]NSM05565.1 immunoglobulin heavy chain junction region [Mus musculus]
CARGTYSNYGWFAYW